MPAQVTRIDLAAEARVVRRFAGEDARAPEAEEAFGPGAPASGYPASQDSAQRFAKSGVPREGGEHPAEMVAKYPLFTVRLELEGVEPRGRPPLTRAGCPGNDLPRARAC